MTTTQRVADYLKAADLSRVRDHDIASTLCMSSSALCRKLRAEGTNYTTLLESERKRRVLALIARNPRADTWRIADTAGFNARKTSRVSLSDGLAVMYGISS